MCNTASKLCHYATNKCFSYVWCQLMLWYISYFCQQTVDINTPYWSRAVSPLSHLHVLCSSSQVDYRAKTWACNFCFQRNAVSPSIERAVGYQHPCMQPQYATTVSPHLVTIVCIDYCVLINLPVREMAVHVPLCVRTLPPPFPVPSALCWYQWD